MEGPLSGMVGEETGPGAGGASEGAVGVATMAQHINASHLQVNCGGCGATGPGAEWQKSTHAGCSGGRTMRKRRAMSRRALLGAGGSGAAALLAACAPGAQESGPVSSKQPVTLRFVPAGFHADLDQIVVDQYAKENPHVTINFEPIPTEYVNKITALQAGGDLPDVIYVADAHVKPFAANKIAADMEKLAAKDKASQDLLKDVYPNMLALGKVKSIPGLYMLPWALDVLLMYYNKTLFQQAGVELPKPTWTVDDMINAARRLTKPHESGDPAQGQYGLTLSWTAWAEYVPWMRGYGGGLAGEEGKKEPIDAPGSEAGSGAVA